MTFDIAPGLTPNFCEAFDGFDQVGKIDIPVLIFAGDADKLIKPACSEWLNKNIAGSRLHILKGVGHMAPLEAPKELATLIPYLTLGPSP